MLRHAPLIVLTAITLGCREKDALNDSGLLRVDVDGDGFIGSVDCDDDDVSVYPGAAEVCNGVDDNCDGQVDEGTTATFYTDADADGYGDEASAVEACEAPAGAVTVGGDCDDGDPAYNPGAVEDDCADPNDYNCDGSVGFDDADADGFPACEDCDDADAARNPDAVEVCDDQDNDCDGLTDDADDSLDLSSASTFYADADADGHGDPAAPVQACEPPAGAASSSADCDDADAEISPDADEVCDGLDNDCDALVDDDDDSLDPASASLSWMDQDGDGYGDPDDSSLTCLPPAGHVDNARDCDDTDAEVNPAGVEVCDGLDNDCDGDVDDDDAGLDTTTASTWYADADADGYGAAAYTRVACEAPSGHVGNADDCDDADAAISPVGVESCDRDDNDCDGQVDEGVTTDWTLDIDGDGYGDDATAVAACTAPTSAYIATGGDCDDRDTAYNPGASEGCDGNDYNCDGVMDNDADADGYPDIACGGNDCDDADATLYPDSSGDCALGTSCLDILSGPYSSGDGLYSIDPDGFDTGDDPEEVWCDMSSHGGGWTLIAMNHPGNSQLSNSTLASITTFGTPTGAQDYKALAFSNLPFTDLMFTDGTLYAVYEGVDGGTQPFYDFQAAIPAPNCGSRDGYNWSMTAGDLSGSSLCDTDLYMHPIDEDGGVNTSCSATFATYTSNGTGPAWSISRNNGCPHDDASSNTFASHATGTAWDSASPLMMYAR